MWNQIRIWNKTEWLTIPVNKQCVTNPSTLHYLNWFGNLDATFCPALLPSCSSQRSSPSLSLLGRRGMSWENKLQTAYGTSSPCISWVSPRLLVSSPCVIPHESICAFSFFPTGEVLRRLLRTVPPGAAGNITDQHYFDFSIKWGEQTAPVGAKRRQHFERATLQEPSCTSDRRQL